MGFSDKENDIQTVSISNTFLGVIKSTKVK